MWGFISSVAALSGVMRCHGCSATGVRQWGKCRDRVISLLIVARDLDPCVQVHQSFVMLVISRSEFELAVVFLLFLLLDRLI